MELRFLEIWNESFPLVRAPELFSCVFYVKKMTKIYEIENWNSGDELKLYPRVNTNNYIINVYVLE